jgi:hypothetical protein
MKQLEEFYRLKDGYAPLTRYLGAEVKQWRFPENAEKAVWALSSFQYVKEAVRNVENHLQTMNHILPKVHQPLPSNYYLELDIAPTLDDDKQIFIKATLTFSGGLSNLAGWTYICTCLHSYCHI